jgi:MoaA/NifB/PqqE/SkfB family radical SAM enzyme
MGVLLEAARRIEDAYPGSVCLRVSTNGLVPGAIAEEVARSLWDAGVRKATVAIASADEAQHRLLLAPRGAAIEMPGGNGPAAGAPGLAEACQFVRALVAAGLEVECTAVAEPSVDLAAAGLLAASLGASFRSRSYHP